MSDVSVLGVAFLTEPDDDICELEERSEDVEERNV